MRQLLRALLPALLLIASLPAGAQYPAKPVRLLVGFAPGGGVDSLARQLAQKLTERWGKPVVVENRSGAAGNIATGIVAKSALDGYTLLLAFSSHASNPALYPDLPFDIRKDFTAVTLVATAPVTVAVHPSVPAANLAELIAHARSHPDAVRFASSGVGTPVHLAGELMMQLTGIRMTHVPYKGIAPALAAMLGAETEVTFPAVLSGLQHFRSGRLKALAVASRNRFPGLPEVPTAAEAGLAGVRLAQRFAPPRPGRPPAPLCHAARRRLPP